MCSLCEGPLPHPVDGHWHTRVWNRAYNEPVCCACKGCSEAVKPKKEQKTRTMAVTTEVEKAPRQRRAKAEPETKVKVPRVKPSDNGVKAPRAKRGPEYKGQYLIADKAGKTAHAPVSISKNVDPQALCGAKSVPASGEVRYEATLPEGYGFCWKCAYLKKREQA